MNVDIDAEIMPEDPELLDQVRVEEPDVPQVDVREGIHEFERAEKDLKNIINNVCLFLIITLPLILLNLPTIFFFSLSCPLSYKVIFLQDTSVEKQAGQLFNLADLLETNVRALDDANVKRKKMGVVFKKYVTKKHNGGGGGGGCLYVLFLIPVFFSLTVIGEGADATSISTLWSPIESLLAHFNPLKWYIPSPSSILSILHSAFISLLPSSILPLSSPPFSHSPFSSLSHAHNLISFRFHPVQRGTDFDIVHNLTGFCKDGEMLLVLGRPGSGCSTLLRVLANQRDSYKAVTGDVMYGGLPASDFKVRKKKRRGEGEEARKKTLKNGRKRERGASPSFGIC
jgi:hypothetical protein